MSTTGIQPELSESAQIRLILDGNSEQFGELVRPYHRSLYFKALSIVHIQEDAEEITQNAVLKAFTKLGQFRHDAQFRTWLTSITINEARMWLRANGRIKHERFDDEDGEGQQPRLDIADRRENPFQALERKEIKSAIIRALTILSSRERQVFILRDVRQLSIAATAQILSISESNVKSRLRRARLRMRQALAHLRGTQASRTGNGPISSSRRLPASARICTWPTVEHEMEIVQ
jgi:RNA polymerase sigma-70 factor, ECF subfamily